jgi:hypothetical protein
MPLPATPYLALLRGIREQLLDETVIDYAAAQLKYRMGEQPQREDISAMMKSEARLRLELETGGSTTLHTSLKKKEGELARLEKTIKATAHDQHPVASIVEEARRGRILQLPQLLNCDSDRARTHLMEHVGEIQMKPTEEHGKKFYIAEGEWLVAEDENATGAKLNGDIRLPHMVAGARNATWMSFSTTIQELH